MNLEIEKFTDEWGPEKILYIYNPEIGLKCVLVIDNTVLGPGKGGIRMLPTITTAEIFRLARTMTWKCALMKLPFGGAKSGIIADPRQISTERKTDIIRAFSRALKPVCPKLYVAAPDMNTGENDMAVFALENGSMKSVTGKPANMCVRPGVKCGIPHEYGSTGFGVVQSVLVVTDNLGLDVEGLTAAVEGFGNVGSFVTKYLTECGIRVVGVSDSKGCIYNPEGLEYGKLSEVKTKTGSVINYCPGKVFDNKKLFELPVDILIPAALPDVITKDNMGSVKAKIIIEAANIPMRPEIEEILRKRGFLVVPDILANAGGVVSSYAEYSGYNPKEMFNLVQKKISQNTRAVLEYSVEKDIGLREAALSIAKERIRKERGH